MLHGAVQYLHFNGLVLLCGHTHTLVPNCSDRVSLCTKGIRHALDALMILHLNACRLCGQRVGVVSIAVLRASVRTVHCTTFSRMIWWTWAISCSPSSARASAFLNRLRSERHFLMFLMSVSMAASAASSACARVCVHQDYISVQSSHQPRQ